MANALNYKEKRIAVGDTITVDYKFKESETKTRIQPFKGILLNIKGKDDANRMITVRKVAKTGVGVERIFPVNSPFVADIHMNKASNYTKAKLFFVRELSGAKISHKLYRSK